MELEDIKKYLDGSNYVILEGIGGIGKSELAKKYVLDNKERYNIIQFINFKDSLLSTIADSLEVYNFDYSKYEKEYSKEKIFKEKMSILKKTSKNRKILIVIDNFNVAADDNFHRFVSNEYKVIFTSRERHSGNVVVVKSMESDGDLKELFSVYYHSRVHLEPKKMSLKMKLLFMI